ncbi:rab-GTPase-TBC domain-containing protein [Russula aff. rugulosa BPL654]|nr:rab-GTPase-TBC domain-containing protein [Russula aff. rugulosa BPL654]
MVEIKRETTDDQPTQVQDGAKYRLIYTKSKVYVNPTAYARDNIPGFVAIVKREAVTLTYLLAWIPESLLTEKGKEEWNKFLKTEERPDEDEDGVLIDLPTPRPESYAFSVPLSSVYSLIVQPPSLSSWYGSIGINLISGSTLPTLYFHDDESHSFTIPSKSASSSNASTSYPPPPSLAGQAATGRPITSWGGEDLLSRLRLYASLLRSNLQSTLYLVDPSKADIEVHSTQLFSDDAVDEILARSSYTNSYSPVPAHRRPRPLSAGGAPPNPYSQYSSVLHQSMPMSPSNPGGSSQARTALLQSFANITRATKHAAQNILSHPLAKPIVPHLPDPVKSLVSANGDLEWGSWVEKGGVGEFESARVYLARWARIVAEEGERARRREAQSIPANVAASTTEESGELGIFELLHSTANLPTPKSTRDPTRPVGVEVLREWFGPDGRPLITTEKLRAEIFRRGVSDKDNARRELWPYLLGVYAWDVTQDERQRLWEAKMKRYHEIKDEWFGNAEERHRIDVDCRRTDRTQPLFANQTPSETMLDREKQQYQRYSTISPTPVEHIDRLGSILLTYNFYEKDLGYVQGMSDLCAPLYVVAGSDEPLTFWCFVEVMNRMKQNFLRDQSGMKKQLSTLQQLLQVMDPELYRHFEKTEGLNLFFCFRWILISFKREFPFEDVLRLWEVLWTDYYMNGMSHRDVMLRYLVEFDEILKVRVLSLPRLFVSKGWIPGLKWPCGPVSIATS